VIEGRELEGRSLLGVAGVDSFDYPFFLSRAIADSPAVVLGLVHSLRAQDHLGINSCDGARVRRVSEGWGPAVA